MNIVSVVRSAAITAIAVTAVYKVGQAIATRHALKKVKDIQSIRDGYTELFVRAVSSMDMIDQNNQKVCDELEIIIPTEPSFDCKARHPAAQNAQKYRENLSAMRVEILYRQLGIPSLNH